MSWSPPRKYKGNRTNYVHAIKITIPYPDPGPHYGGRSMLMRTGPNPNMVKLAEMEDWCEDNCMANWSSFGYSTWYFDRMNEAVMFKMIFGGK
jgi:hypothetical protein